MRRHRRLPGQNRRFGVADMDKFAFDHRRAAARVILTGKILAIGITHETISLDIPVDIPSPAREASVR